jgi:hypothetical protein
MAIQEHTETHTAKPRGFPSFDVIGHRVTDLQQTLWDVLAHLAVAHDSLELVTSDATGDWNCAEVGERVVNVRRVLEGARGTLREVADELEDTLLQPPTEEEGASEERGFGSLTPTDPSAQGGEHHE